MKNVCRIIDKENFEIYSIDKDRSLQFIARSDIEELKHYKFNVVIISANLTNSSEMGFDNPNYTPAKNSFIFSHRSILLPNDVLFSRPVYSDKMRRWTQVWTSRRLIKSILGEKLTKNLSVYFEECSLVPSEGRAIWASGDVCIEFDNDMYITKREVGRQFLEKLSPSLDGFKLSKSNFTTIEDLRVKSIDLLLFVISTFSFIISLMVFSNTLPFTKGPAKTFNNTLVELQNLESIQSDLNLGSVKNLEINKTLSNLSIEFFTQDDFLSFKKAYENQLLFIFDNDKLKVTIDVKQKTN